MIYIFYRGKIINWQESHNRKHLLNSKLWVKFSINLYYYFRISYIIHCCDESNFGYLALISSLRSLGILIVIFTYASPFFPYFWTDVHLVDIDSDILVAPFFVGSDKRVFESFFHFEVQVIKGDLFIFLPLVVDSLKYAYHVVLDVLHRGHFQHERTHEIIVHVACFLLQVSGLVARQLLRSLVVLHRQVHNTIDMGL